MLLVTAGCKMHPVGPPLSAEELYALVDASDWEAVAHSRLDCEQPGNACAAAHASHADACLRLAIQLPVEASATRGQTRRLLDSAESGYRQAIALQRSSDAPSLASYHGGLLLTLSERRNRLDVSEQEQRLERENEKLLEAAEQARSAVADSALGFIYGASAHVYRALRREPGADRCDDLRQAAAMLQQAPSPPAELSGEAQRLQTLVTRELQENACPTSRHEV
ncbi:hypothetical protein [Halochromatium glycolicum]|nr:hypothetical protein [Halochromatium glycolicum]